MDGRTKQMARQFQWPVLVAALLVVPVIVLQELEPTGAWKTVAVAASWTIWLLFLAELFAMLSVAPSRWAWLKSHPLEVAVVVLTPPFLPASMQAARIFRLLRLVRLVLTVQRLRVLFTLDGLRYPSIVAAFGILAGGAAFAAVETRQDLSAWDGVYWALTTVTTVGYGDIGPETDAGRAIAIAVMLTGIAYVAILTAAIAQQFFAAVAAEPGITEKEADVIARLDELNARLARLEEAIRRS
jgi:voltage-gated potassium channel